MKRAENRQHAIETARGGRVIEDGQRGREIAPGDAQVRVALLQSRERGRVHADRGSIRRIGKSGEVLRKGQAPSLEPTPLLEAGPLVGGVADVEGEDQRGRFRRMSFAFRRTSGSRVS